MRCPDCNKFTGLEAQEPEVQSEDIDSNTGAVSFDVRIVRQCTDCGNELQEANITIEDDCSEVCTKHHEDKHGGEVGPDGPDYSLEDVSAEVDEYQSCGRDKKGNERKFNPRYAKSYIGARVSYEVHCNLCDTNIHSGEAVGHEQASGFESLV